MLTTPSTAGDTAPAPPAPLRASVQAWLDQTRTQLQAGEQLSPAQLDTLQAILEKPTQVRQRVMYIHLTTPVPTAQAIACAIFEPGSEAPRNEISAEEPVLPYSSAAEAIADGWHILALPDMNAPIDDREIDMLGYLFVLQKLEVFHD